jgi:anti-sigma B factor antagonist
VAVVRPIGDLDVATMSSFQLRVASILEAGTRHLVVDLSGVPFMDSSGLASLVHLFKTARASQGDLRLAGPRTDLVRLLEITHLNRVFAVYDSEAACLASFR